MPRTGKGIAGIATWYENIAELTEYIQVKLMDTLKQGNDYYIQFYVSLADSFKYASDRIGAHFSDTGIHQNSWFHFPYDPQVENDSGNVLTNKTGWTKISGTFNSQGVETYLTIGNFEADSNTVSITMDSSITKPEFLHAYYYIDDICVALDSMDCICQKLYALDFYSDTNVIKQDSCVNYYIDENIRYDHFEWQFEGGIPATDTGRSPSDICYSVPGSYNVILIATDTNGCTDTIRRYQHMTVSPADHTGSVRRSEVVKVYPNPSIGLIQVELPPELHHLNGVFTLFNIKGQKVLQTTLTGKQRNDILLSRNNYPTGTYLYQMELDDESKYTGKVNLMR